MLTREETELVWLTKRVNEQTDQLKRLKEFFDERQADWPRPVVDNFAHEIEALKDQLFFEQSRLEKLAWKIHEERERIAGEATSFDEELLRDS